MRILIFLIPFLLAFLNSQRILKLDLLKVEYLQLEKIVFQGFTRGDSFARFFLQHPQHEFSCSNVQQFIFFVRWIDSCFHVGLDELFSGMALEDHLVCESKLKFNYKMWNRHPKENISHAFPYLFFDTLTSELKESMAP